jgi:hypothetical protein
VSYAGSTSEKVSLIIVSQVTWDAFLVNNLRAIVNAEEILPGDDFEPAYPSDVEKFDFPSNEKVIPTFAATLDVIPSMIIHNESAEVKHAETSIVFPSTVHVRSPSNGSSISRHDTSNERTTLDNNSDSRSHSRTNSNRSQASDASIHKRWVIE